MKSKRPTRRWVAARGVAVTRRSRSIKATSSSSRPGSSAFAVTCTPKPSLNSWLVPQQPINRFCSVNGPQEGSSRRATPAQATSEATSPSWGNARHVLAILRRAHGPVPLLALAAGFDEMYEADVVVDELEARGLVTRASVQVAERRQEAGVAVTDVGRRTSRWRRCAPGRRRSLS